ncbi:hypothetical protein CEXT_493631 [Caerostris extrusa]|uniref:Uncharacterized protein n=1 Tax=Caerostris extrusa TaxID=172846 RepID=A0AAV4PD49_CAEEX|nr:hypothetical protein CEXT_493631 [Caerostris extrusa]
MCHIKQGLQYHFLLLQIFRSNTLGALHHPVTTAAFEPYGVNVQNDGQRHKHRLSGSEQSSNNQPSNPPVAKINNCSDLPEIQWDLWALPSFFSVTDPS